MYTITNVLRNHLDQRLAENILQLFLNDANENSDGTLQVCEIEKIPIKNLSEERFKVKFEDTTKTCTIIFKFVVQGMHVKDSADFGCPYFYYQGVTEIHFAAVKKEIAETMQTRFEVYLKKLGTNKQYYRIVKDIALRSNKK